MMITEGTVKITVITGKSSVAAEAELVLDGIYYSSSGFSKCDPADTFDPAVGMEIAVGRAVRQLGRDIYNVGNDAVKYNDAIRAKRIAEQDKITRIKKDKARLARKEYLDKFTGNSKKALAKATAKR